MKNGYPGSRSHNIHKKVYYKPKILITTIPYTLNRTESEFYFLDVKKSVSQHILGNMYVNARKKDLDSLSLRPAGPASAAGAGEGSAPVIQIVLGLRKGRGEVEGEGQEERGV